MENGRSLWQLKLPRSDRGVELEEAGGPGTVPERLASLLSGVLRERVVTPFSVLRTRRDGYRVRRDGRDVADVVLDRVASVDGARTTESFQELEIERVSGSEHELESLERYLTDAGARRGAGTPKAFRAVLPEPGAAQSSADAAAFAELVRRQYAELLAHDPGARLGDDPEDIHDLRVAARRLRAVLRATRSALPPEAEDLRAELKWLGGELGRARDLDVLVEHLRASAAARLERSEQAAFERVLTRLEHDRRHEARTAIAALDSARHGELLGRLDTFVGQPPLVHDPDLEAVAAAEFQRLRKAKRRLPTEPSNEELHALRIRAKRARYAAELAEPVMGKRAKRVVDRAKAIQDVLGDHQDAVVAEGRLRALAADADSLAALAAGRLIERERQRRAEARADLPRAWKRLKRAGRRAFA
jgi:CHAD domain-containing protein